MSKVIDKVLDSVRGADTNIPPKSKLTFIGMIQSMNKNNYYYVLNKTSNAKYFVSPIDYTVSILGSGGALIKIT